MKKQKQEPLLAERVKNAIFDHADLIADGYAYATLSRSQLALILNASEKAVRWAIAYLIERGEIEREGKRAFGGCSIYRLRV